jgi:hypothetical protein
MTNGKGSYRELIERLIKVHEAKSHDYAKSSDKFSNFKYAALLSQEFTDSVDRVFATLIGVKLARLAELRSSGKNAKNESVADTFLDLTNYAGLWWFYHESQQELAAQAPAFNPQDLIPKDYWNEWYMPYFPSTGPFPKWPPSLNQEWWAKTQAPTHTEPAKDVY